MRFSSILVYEFVEIPKTDCPCSDNDGSGCKTLPECSYDLDINDLCEADSVLPNGNTVYDVNNCRIPTGNFDVFRYIGGEVQISTYY